jgi:ATP-dependent Clp protease ATP-binding subunit ClpB
MARIIVDLSVRPRKKPHVTAFEPDFRAPHVTPDGQLTDQARTAVMTALREYFRPEFLNPVDETVLFKPLTLPEIERIVDLLLDDLRARLADRRITVEVTEAARRFIAEAGFDPVFGARPLRRFLQREVETRIARTLLTGDGRRPAV